MFHERAWLDVPGDWIPEGAGDCCGQAQACGLEIPLAIELARTTLTARDWACVESGDAIVFDEPLPRPQDAWPVRFTCAGFLAAATFLPQGTIQLSTGFRDRAPRAVPDGDWEQTTTTGREIMGSNDRDASPATVLASAPIEVVAEVGRVVLRADELLALRSGSVLSLGPLRPTTVDLRVGDRVWAQGELVNVDGQLGVRVTAVAANGTASIKDQLEAETVRTSRGDQVG
jgi:type III secretion system YscQ/HrcQ family protein